MNSQKIYFYIQSVIIEKYRKRIGGVEWKIVEHLLEGENQENRMQGFSWGMKGQKLRWRGKMTME